MSSVLKLEEVSLDPAQVERAPDDIVGCIQGVGALTTSFSCKVENLMAFILKRLHPDKPERWLTRRSTKITIIYEHILRDPGRSRRGQGSKRPTIPVAVRKVVMAILEWLRNNKPQRAQPMAA